MTKNHDDIKKECHAYSETLFVAICCVCKKIFYNTEDLDKHNKLEIQCTNFNLCTTADNPEFDYCAAMEQC